MLQNLPELPPAPPPDYATVVKEKEEEEDLPSYFQVFAYATLTAHGTSVKEEVQNLLSSFQVLVILKFT